MAAPIYINAVCTIKDRIIQKDEKTVFTGSDSDAMALLSDAYKHFDFNYPKFYKMDNLSKLGFISSEILLKNSFQHSKYTPEEIGIILANASSSLDTDLRYFDTVTDIASPSLFVYTLPNIVIGEISIKNNFKGENAFFISGHFDTDFIQDYVTTLMDSNALRACICGWVEFINNEYNTFLFLVETEKNARSVPFEKNTINNYIS